MFFGRRKRIEVLENEIRTYQMYIKPLEELVREIRAAQHEFDNHLNAILNMHYTIDNYDELVEAQSKYIQNMYSEDTRQLTALLKISDKILAGFLYSKIHDIAIASRIPEQKGMDLPPLIFAQSGAIYFEKQKTQSSNTIKSLIILQNTNIMKTVF